MNILTIGQYLQPTKQHLPVDRWVTPEEFRRWKEFGLSIGFGVVESGPLVRSSYHADEQSQKYTGAEHLNTTNAFASRHDRPQQPPPDRGELAPALHGRAARRSSGSTSSSRTSSGTSTCSRRSTGCPCTGREKPMPTATAGNITIINFGMGSANAATVMDLLSAIKPKAALFLGKCGGIKHRAEVGDLILPIAAIRGEGTSNDYFPPEVPALPSFALQKAISTTIRDHALDYWTGTVYTTNRRVWEHDDEFKKYLRKIRVMAVDMETATIFMVGFANEIPTGALLLVSDQPMVPEGVKTIDSDKKVDNSFVGIHLRIGIDSLKQLINKGLTVKHLKF